MSLKLLVQLLE